MKRKQCQHFRKYKSGRRILVNKGQPKRFKRKMTVYKKFSQKIERFPVVTQDDRLLSISKIGNKKGKNIFVGDSFYLPLAFQEKDITLKDINKFQDDYYKNKGFKKTKNKGPLENYKLETELGDHYGGYTGKKIWTNSFLLKKNKNISPDKIATYTRQKMEE